MIVAESGVILIGELSLPAEPVRVGEARRHVAAVIRDWKVSVDVDTAVLLTSEVFTNAILHGAAAGGQIRLVEAWDGQRFRIEVHDPRPAGPDLRDFRDRPLDAVTGESGRGLGMVEMLADRWGVERTDDGKQVYFVLGALGHGGADEAHGNRGTSGTTATCGTFKTAGTTATYGTLGNLSALAPAGGPQDACSGTTGRPVRSARLG